MSKVAQAKAAQNFQAKPKHPRCADCQHFTMDTERITSRWSGDSYSKESNLRCTLGGFKVGKNSVCAHFARKPAVVEGVAS